MLATMFIFDVWMLVCLGPRRLVRVFLNPTTFQEEFFQDADDSRKWIFAYLVIVLRMAVAVALTFLTKLYLEF